MATQKKRANWIMSN